MKITALTAIGATYTAYTTARDVVQAVTHPITWVRDKIKELLIEAIVDLALAALSDDIKQSVRDKVANHQKTVDFALPVPALLHSTLDTDSRGLTLLHEMANDALAAPLALLGYRVGSLDLAWDAEAKAVQARLEVGLRNSSAPAIAADKEKPATLS